MLSGSSRETLRKRAGNFQEALRKLSGNSQEALRKLSGDSQEALRKISGGSQEALRRLSEAIGVPRHSDQPQMQKVIHLSAKMQKFPFFVDFTMCF